MSDSGSPLPPPPPIFSPAPAAPTGPSGSGLSGGAVPPVLPPPLLRVPPSAPAPAPAPRRSGRRWWTASLVLGGLVVLGALGYGVVSGLGRFAHLAHGGSHLSIGASELTETVIESHGSHDKVAIIPVDGVISSGGENGSLVDLIRGQLERAADDDHVKAVVLRVDSPGGEVLASDEIADALRDFQSGPNGKPVVVSMQSICASGGYYISAPCRWIVAHELTITGSIGVIFHGYNYRGLMDKVGVRPKTTKSGKLKDMWSPDKLPEEELPEEKAIMQDMVEESFARFKKVIREGRAWSAQENQAWVEDVRSGGGSVEEGDAGRKLGEDWETVADGRVMSGTRALEYGFVDEVGDFRVAVDRAERIVGIEDASLVSYDPPVHFPGFLRLLGQSNVKSVKLDLGELAGLVPKLPQGRLYFLSPAFVH